MDAFWHQHILDTVAYQRDTVQIFGYFLHHFPYFGIWAAKDAPFVCLEPWCGIADNIDHDYQFTHKEGINQLEVNKSWQRTWNVEVF